MRCPECGAWSSRVLDTRPTPDGYTINRKHECANTHRFTSVQVMQSVYCSAKQRNRAATATAQRRAKLSARNAYIRRELAKGRRGVDLAAELRVSPSLVSLVRPGTKAKIMAGERVHWVFNHKTRADYLLAIVLSAPPWVDKWELEALRAWAAARTAFTGELHVLDHIVPVTHPAVCGLTVPWNLQVIHWRANGAKGNKWAPDQLELW